MRNFFKAFIYAWNGILEGFRSERNLKFHMFAAIVVIGAGVATGLTGTEWFIVFVLIAGMLALEMMNSAIERVVDLVTVEQHPLAKEAKDIAAGAVLIFAVASAVIGLLLFIPKWFNY
ncbi:diacylglycerol kinase family protein [Filibacter tadaridae]|uniref:Undecaprenol kinase n=1 Tax=Filibacter tadaridae TaxID=2483811 RepID=A0A3P5XCN4_9BACL|nr:diacylglycerol kinase family protein [Filibacter tadaridae]VDC32466.1 Undecaprenol kinase [Filibacter tadaridae]